MRVGVAGLGRMGSAIAARLREVGHDLIVWNRSRERMKPLVEAGAKAAANPADLARDAEAIITMLTDAAAIEAVYRGPSGLLSANATGKLFIEMSTVQPQTQVALAEAVRARGGAFVECPVGGTTGPARAGKLIGLVGAEAADLARARPLLEQLCRRIEHVGRVGAGASVKLAINLPLLVSWQALGEAYSLCRHLGLDPAPLMDLFADTSGGTNALKLRGAAVATALAGGDAGPATFDVDSIRKDLRTMLAEAAAHGIELPLVERTLTVYDEASEAGWGARDSTALPAYWPSRKPAPPVRARRKKPA